MATIILRDDVGVPSGTLYLNHHPHNAKLMELELEDENGDAIMVKINKNNFKVLLNTIEDEYDTMRKEVL